jgi:hypothetical protein
VRWLGNYFFHQVTASEKIKWLLITGCIALDWLYNGCHHDAYYQTHFHVILCTRFWWLVLAGFVFFYWWIDLRNHKKYVQFFIVVGMNSLFIPIYSRIVGVAGSMDILVRYPMACMSIIHVPLGLMGIVTSLVIFSLEWAMCRFLYRKGIFFKI